LLLNDLRVEHPHKSIIPPQSDALSVRGEQANHAEVARKCKYFTKFIMLMVNIL